MMIQIMNIIDRFVLIHGDKYDYSLVNYINTNTKVKIVCKEHGVFEQIPKSHLKGSGCSKCNGGTKLDNKTFIEKAESLYNDRYDYSLINYEKSSAKIKIICKEHGVFEQTPASHLQKHGCPKCYGNVKSNSIDFIKRCKNVHRDIYDYSLVEYINNKRKIKIICKEHGIFEQVPTKHILRGDGCPKCASKKRGEETRLSKDSFIKRTNEIHKNKYDYSLVEYKSACDNKKIEIVCPIHGMFKQQPSSHMNGCGCPKCANKEHGKHNAINRDIFIHRSNEIHKNKYDYSLVNCSNVQTKVKIICRKHGIFEQLPSVHMNGCGCSSCQNSKGEDKIKTFLDENKIIYKKEHSFKDCRYKLPLKFDFYLPYHNICIEYDGEQHFKKWHKGDTDENFNIRKNRDRIKNDYCKNKSIELLRIHYTDLKNINFILTEKLKNNIN